MKNRVKKQILSALLAFVVAAPLYAMDNGDKSDRKRLYDDGQESESKVPRLDDEIIDESNESPLVIEKKEQQGTIPVIILAQGTPVVESKICWDEIEDLFMDPDIDSDHLRKILDKYVDVMSHDAHDFEHLMAVCFYDVEIEHIKQAVVDIIGQYGKPLLKAICANDMIMAEQLLKSGDVVFKEHLFCAIYRKNKELFDLLLQYAPFNLNDDVSFWDKSLCAHIYNATEQQGFSWVQNLLKHGYKPTYNDIADSLERDDFESFKFLMNSISDVNTVFEDTTFERENLLVLAIQQRLGHWYVALLLDKKIPLHNCEDLIVKILAHYRFEVSGEIITDDGKSIMRMLGNAFKVDREYLMNILKKVNDQAMLLKYLLQEKWQQVEELLLKGVDPNIYINDNNTEYTSVVSLAAQRSDVDRILLLLIYCARLDDFVIARAGRYIYSDDVKLCIDAAAIIIKNSLLTSSKISLINSRMEDDWSNKRCDYVQIMLQHSKAAQRLLFHSPYQWINAQFPKKIFDGKTNQICEISDEQWLEHKLKTNAQKFDKQGNRKPESQSLYALFTMGNKLTQRLSDKKFSDVLFKTQE